MGKIDLKPGSIVNYMGEQWKVLKTIDFHNLKIQNVFTNDVFVVSIDDLQSNIVETDLATLNRT